MQRRASPSFLLAVVVLALAACPGSEPSAPPNVYGVSYEANGGAGAVPTDEGRYREGATVTVLGAGALTRNGYTFAGWNTEPDGHGTPLAAGATFDIGAADVVLYAVWTADPTYGVAYDANGGTGQPPVDANRYLLGATVTVLGAGGLTRSGYTFAGWNTEPDGYGTPLAAGATFDIGAADVVLYAVWTADPTYGVTYDANGGTGQPPVDANRYLLGATVTVLGAGTLTRYGYTFAGWNTEPDGHGTPRAAGATFDIGAADVVLYAVWTADPTYGVTYDANGGTGQPPVDANRYLLGATVTVLSRGSLQSSGLLFSGWNTAANGTGTERLPGSTFTMGGADVRLYARWRAPTWPALAAAGAVSINNALVENDWIGLGDSGLAGSTITSGATVVLNGSAHTVVSGGVTASTAAHLIADVAQNLTTLGPAQLWSRLFARSKLEVRSDPAVRVITDCSSLDAASLSGIAWLACSTFTPGALTIGSPYAPVLLVVDGNVNLGGTVVYGVVYATGVVNMSGSSTRVQGMLAGESAINMLGGEVRSDPAALVTLGFSNDWPSP